MSDIKLFRWCIIVSTETLVNISKTGLFKPSLGMSLSVYDSEKKKRVFRETLENYYYSKSGRSVLFKGTVGILSIYLDYNIHDSTIYFFDNDDFKRYFTESFDLEDEPSSALSKVLYRVDIKASQRYNDDSIEVDDQKDKIVNNGELVLLDPGSASYADVYSYLMRNKDKLKNYGKGSKKTFK